MARTRALLFVLTVCCGVSAYAQTRTIRGQVLNPDNEPVIGAAVVATERMTEGTSTSADGRFTLTVSGDVRSLTVSFLGMIEQLVPITGISDVTVTLQPDNVQIDEVIVVGYGQQKKASVVGAITQTTGEVLERAGGVSNVGSALTGNLPGVVTVSTRGTPGDEDPQIYIRGQSSWNNSSPLILVDGIERPMNSVDISSIESISVLKDASATAVFGVKGANGVILITTKRGREGKTEIRISANSTIKVPSLLAGKYDSFDALDVRNDAIVRELGLYPSSWDKFTPQGILDKYRNPANQTEAERYPNVDWADVLVNDFAMSHNINTNITGGTSFVKYFTSVDYLYEGDILKKIDSGKGYSPAYGFNRVNVRSNLDLNLTQSTVLSVNLSGSYGVRQDVYGQDSWEYRIWQSIYSNPPDAYMPRYADGSWGYYPPDEVGTINSAATMANNGIRKRTNIRINTDFTLKQDLSMLVQGLSAKGTLSFDNAYQSTRGVYDNGDNLHKYIDPDTGEARTNKSYGSNQFDWIPAHWGTRVEEANNGQNYRKLFYQIQTDWVRSFGDHDVTLMGAFNREQWARGSEFEHFREDWVFRGTYAYRNKYMLDVNGAYNGSEQFGPEYRFGFFPSGAVGWTISEESFMKGIKFLNMLKLRASYGEIGDDNISNTRWLYMTDWTYGSATRLGNGRNQDSPYVWYKESKVGNSDIHWEKVAKTNFGVDFSFLRGLISGSVDVFQDHRTDILMSGGSRSIPPYFGATPSVANLGEVRVKGYEIAIRVNRVLSNGMRLWGDFNMTHAKDEILEADDPQLKDWYQKQVGKQIGQRYSHVNGHYYNTWDEVLSSTPLDTYDNEKLPGNLHIVDFNGDGVIDSYDSAPWGYPERPQNTYNATLGFDWKGFSAFVQFYGVNNAHRTVDLRSFSGYMNRVYDQGTLWSMNDSNADAPMPRWNSHRNYYGQQYVYDSSYIRLKNVEVAYTFNQPWVKRVGVQSLRVYLNANNLWMWTHMPDDREVNMGQGSAYPTVRRINLGINITL